LPIALPGGDKMGGGIYPPSQQ